MEKLKKEILSYSSYRTGRLKQEVRGTSPDVGLALALLKINQGQFSSLSCFNGHSPREGTKEWGCFLTCRIAQVMSTKIFHQGFC